MMKTQKLIKALKNYKRGWVSVSKDYGRVQASGGSLGVVLEKLHKLGNPPGYLMKAAGDYSRYVGI